MRICSYVGARACLVYDRQFGKPLHGVCERIVAGTARQTDFQDPGMQEVSCVRCGSRSCSVQILLTLPEEAPSPHKKPA